MKVAAKGINKMNKLFPVALASTMVMGAFAEVPLTGSDGGPGSSRRRIRRSGSSEF